MVNKGTCVTPAPAKADFNVSYVHIKIDNFINIKKCK